VLYANEGILSLHQLKVINLFPVLLIYEGKRSSRHEVDALRLTFQPPKADDGLCNSFEHVNETCVVSNRVCEGFQRLGFVSEPKRSD